jgi:hypothetical protein
MHFMKFMAICKPPNLGNTESVYLGTDGSLEIASSAIIRILER